MLYGQTSPRTTSDQSKSLREALAPAITRPDAKSAINPDDFLELQIIAQQIAGDLDLEISIGIAGQGSFFSFEPLRITLDPAHILDDPEFAKFVAGHEGAHRRFSISPYELIQSHEEIEELYGQTGFHATMNTIEDCAVNDGMSREVPGMSRYTTGAYAKADKEGLHVMTPEIAAIIQRIGREPKFAQALAEMTRDWHNWRKEGGYVQSFESLGKDGRYGTNVDASVLKALRNTRRAVRKAVSSMPKVGEKDVAVLRKFAQERLQIVRDQIHPEIKRLLEEDINLEAMRQGLQSPKDGASETTMSKQLSKQASQEIEKATQEFISETAKEQAQEYQDLKQKLSQEQAKQKEIEQELGEFHKRSASDSSSQDQQENLGNSDNQDKSSTESNASKTTEDRAAATDDGSETKSSETGDSSESAAKAGAGRATASFEELQRALAASEIQEQALKQQLNKRFPTLDHNRNAHSSKAQITAELAAQLTEQLKRLRENPLPYDKLSRRTQHEIEHAFEALAEAEKERLRDLAQQQIEELEHEIASALRPKLEEEPIETAHQRRVNQELGEEQGELIQERLEELSRIQNQLERERNATLTPFDRTFEKVAREVQQATNRLQRVLIPRAFFHWRKDQHVGARINLGRALQSDADPRYLTKLFEQRLNPTQRTHAFEILIDTSSSMGGAKMQSTFEGSVFLAALCENLCVQFEILEFNDTAVIRKSWSDSVKDVIVRDTIAQASIAKHAGTQDAPAVKSAYKRLQAKDAMYKFIIVLTDAESGVSSELQQILKKIEKDGNSVVVHFGIGPGTADSCGLYRHSYGDLQPCDFFHKFCDVVEEIILNPEQFLSEQSAGCFK